MPSIYRSQPDKGPNYRRMPVQKPPKAPMQPIGGTKVCPADVRQCSDGSWVGRDPRRNCAFRSCPPGSTLLPLKSFGMGKSTGKGKSPGGQLV